jgi:thiol-disulfide isomerase/thioredoxin
MQRILIFCAFCLLTLAIQAQPAKKTTPATHTASGYEIPARIAPFKKCWIYMGCYYGKFKNLVDSAWADDNGNAVFKGKEKLPGGIYFMVSPARTILFEFLMDASQHFSVKADTTQPGNVTITGSAENDLFQKYTAFLNKRIPHMNELQGRMKTARNAADSAQVRSELVKANKELNDYRDAVVQQHPNSMLAAFFRSVKRPDAPPMPVLPNGKKDSLYPARYVKEHYWDGMDFTDDRLLRTPFFDQKLEEYFRYYVVPDPDTLIQEVNYMLLSAREGKDLYRYLLGRFTDKYINPEIMGQDKVFLFLFNQYYSKGDTAWLNAKQKEYIFNRAYSLMANQIGEQAPPLNLVDTTGKLQPVYQVKAPFTFVVFWDPNCSHCKVQVPQVDSIYEAKWKAMGVKVYAVNVDESAMDAWKKFIHEHKLNGWVHVYETKEQREAGNKAGRANFRQLYDVFQTPTMYLLDAEKHIIAKKLSVQQFDEVMQAKQKKKPAGG